MVTETIRIVSLIWDSNDKSESFSQMYDESWVVKLFAGFDRNITLPAERVLYTDRFRELPEGIRQIVVPNLGARGYSDCIRPYEMNVPMILVGLDTVIVGSVDHLAEYALNAGSIALPRDPYNRGRACNGVALVPRGMRSVFDLHRGENDMKWLRKLPHVFSDDLWPGHIVSYKGDVRDQGLGDARIVYFHGDEKPHQLEHVDWVQSHWTINKGD